MTDTPATRPQQRRRTREAILAGARALMARDEPVTVVAAAAEQGISKATAYRYFPDAQALVLEAGLDVQVLPYEAVVAGAEGLRDRLIAVSVYMFALAQAHEAQFRRYLARTLDLAAEGRAPEQRRGARRMDYLRHALAEAPGALPPDRAEALVAAMAAVTGIEALIALTDIARLSPAAAAVTARTLAEAVVDRYLCPRTGG
ncbi:MAG: hypothetical protein GC186_12490 [Rhodobacteraceae bacterium]|nr:hypothetical protein [Paracoccaceae bacterium]